MPRAADILLADDERALRDFLKKALERRGFSVRCASDGGRALAMYRARRPDLLLLDVMMPGMGGYAVCEAVRREDAETPVLFLTAFDSEAGELRGLGAGADAYVSKSVSEEVLLARIAAALRRSDKAQSGFDFGEWRVEPLKMSMRNLRGETAALNEREVLLLRAFAGHPGEVFSGDALLTRYFGGGGEPSLRVAMSRLRAKLGAAGADIRSVHGVGYAYDAPVRAIVSLGSNIEPRAEYLSRAAKLLSALPLTRLAAASGVAETEPVDVPAEFSGMKFLNQVVVFETRLEPHDFSRRMHSIEDSLGRTRTVRNGPRTIDIDLVDFGGMALSEPELTLPHPRAKERDFVVGPLAELGIAL